ncbi:MAG: alcohol dehydrogenase catalytic domain-containing protein, partial [Victivallales bacterium]|nr:alcohol dehydrogenase catalytic domain-containing protein [Victivallales bacterium]
TMRAIVVHEIGGFSLDEVPVPKPSKNEVLIRVVVAGICRTDLKIIEVGHRDLELPRVPAEEVVGVVCAIGDGVDKRWLDKRVYVYPGTSCGVCEQCRNGAGNLCKSMRIMGFHRDGGFAEYVSAPIASVIELPENLHCDHAVFAEPLSCCLNALEMARLKTHDRVGIWGAGPAGTLLARAARSMGAKVTVIEPDKRRRELAGGVEDALGEPCFDVVIPAVGSPEAYQSALKCLLPRGIVVAFSGLANKVSSDLLDLNQLHYMEQACVGAYGCSFRHGAEAIEMIADGSVKVDDMISHRMSLSEMDKALDLVRNRESMKILIYPNEADCD